MNTITAAESTCQNCFECCAFQSVAKPSDSHSILTFNQSFLVKPGAGNQLPLSLSTLLHWLTRLTLLCSGSHEKHLSIKVGRVMSSAKPQNMNSRRMHVGDLWGGHTPWALTSNNFLLSYNISSLHKLCYSFVFSSGYKGLMQVNLIFRNAKLQSSWQNTVHSS